MVALPGGTTASAKLWLLAFPERTPASSRIEEPSAVMKASRCSRRTMSIETRLDPRRCDRGLDCPRRGCLHGQTSPRVTPARDVVAAQRPATKDHVAKAGRAPSAAYASDRPHGQGVPNP